MIFRQLFEPLSSTYTYLLGCEETGQAVLIDPAMPEWTRDLGIVHSLGLKLAFTIETHVHADHITSALHLKRESGWRIAYPATSRVECAVPGNRRCGVCPGDLDEHLRQYCEKIEMSPQG
jgi:sulfur dioxygenase